LAIGDGTMVSFHRSPRSCWLIAFDSRQAGSAPLIRNKVNPNVLHVCLLSASDSA